MFNMLIKTGLVLGLLGGGLVSHAHAADSASLKLSVISANKKAGPADPALKRIAKKLKRGFSGHKSFKQLAKHKFELPLKKTKQIKLPNGQTASFTYLGQQKKKHRFKVSIPKSKVDMTVSVRQKGMFFIAKRGIKHKKSDMIMAVMLR